MSPREMSIRVHNIKQAVFTGILIGVMLAEMNWYLNNLDLQIEVFKKIFGI